MTVLQAILLSLVEGITEFLPISSTGHLILVGNLLRVAHTPFTSSFELFIQLGAILAVLSLYWKTLTSEPSLVSKLLASFIPTALAGFLLYPLIKDILLAQTTLICWALIVGGIAFILIEYLLPEQKKTTPISSITFKQAITIGIIQILSFVPGVSRAGATIIGGLLLGLSRETAVTYSFLLAVPTMIAAIGLDMIKNFSLFSIDHAPILAIGFFVSYVTARLAITTFVRFIQTSSFVPFGVYRIVIGILFLFA
jgi:undecaprenyl-diphosphatase